MYLNRSVRLPRKLSREQLTWRDNPWRWCYRTISDVT